MCGSSTGASGTVALRQRIVGDDENTNGRAVDVGGVEKEFVSAALAIFLFGSQNVCEIRQK